MNELETLIAAANNLAARNKTLAKELEGLSKLYEAAQKRIAALVANQPMVNHPFYLKMGGAVVTMTQEELDTLESMEHSARTCVIAHAEGMEKMGLITKVADRPGSFQEGTRLYELTHAGDNVLAAIKWVEEQLEEMRAQRNKDHVENLMFGDGLKTTAQTEPKPSVGRIVHYHSTDPNDTRICRAAMINEVNQNGTVGLTVFGPSSKQEPTSTKIFNIKQGPGFGEWHWPERE